MSRAEPGCATFTLSRSIDEPENFDLFEQYTDEAAFESHRNSPHFGRLMEKGFPLLENRTFDRYIEIEPTTD